MTEIAREDHYSNFLIDIKAREQFQGMFLERKRASWKSRIGSSVGSSVSVVGSNAQVEHIGNQRRSLMNLCQRRSLIDNLRLDWRICHRNCLQKKSKLLHRIHNLATVITLTVVITWLLLVITPRRRLFMTLRSKTIERAVIVEIILLTQSRVILVLHGHGLPVPRARGCRRSRTGQTGSTCWRGLSALPFWTMTKPTIPQISQQNAYHDAQAEYNGAQGTAYVDVEEGEEDSLIGLLVDVRFPTRVHGEHLGGLFFFLGFSLFSTHD
jgi:hypothetical protein